jgi:glycosyltransferase involved in cell wall biosynthesis
MLKPHVGIVASSGWNGGVVYTHNLINALSQLKPSVRPAITLLKHHGDDRYKSLDRIIKHSVNYPFWRNPKYPKVIADAIAICMRSYGHSRREESIGLALAARRARVDCIYPLLYDEGTNHSLMPSPISWIPDFQHRVMPQFFSAEEVARRDKLIKRVLRDSKSVVLSSECARKDAKKYYGEIRANLFIVRFATVPDSSWKFDENEVVNRYKIALPYFIVCNQFWAHKDHITVFKALNILASKNIFINLVCTGDTHDHRNPNLLNRLQQYLISNDLNNYVTILGQIARADQLALLKGALAVIQPSLFEGWSTVLEDARILGVPAIISDIPVHIEQNLPRALVFKQGNPHDCARAISELLATCRSETRRQLTPDMSKASEYAEAFLNVVNATLKSNYK